MKLQSVLLTAALTGCTSSTDHKTVSPTKDTGPSSTDTAEDTGNGDDTGEDTSPPLPSGPCADGTWGGITEPALSFHISAEPVLLSDDWGTDSGSASNPMEEIEDLREPLEEDRISARAIAFWPGIYEADPTWISRAIQAGLRVEACSKEEVSLSLIAAADHEGPLITLGAGSSWDGVEAATLSGLTLQAFVDVPLIAIENGYGVHLQDISLHGGEWSSLLQIVGSADVVLSDASLQGGMPTISVIESDLTLNSVDIINGSIAGIWTAGSTTGIEMDTVSISNIAPAPGITTSMGGFGIVVQGGSFRGENIFISNVAVAGILTDSDDVVLRNVEIDSVATDSAGQFGRGIHLMDSDTTTPAEIILREINIRNTQDAALFIQRVSHTRVRELDINGVGPAAVPTGLGGGNAADGLVVTGRDQTTTSVLTAASSTSVDIEDTLSIVGTGRSSINADSAQIIIEEDIEVSGSPGETTSGIYTQNGGVIISDLASEDLGLGTDEVTEESGGPQCLNLTTPGTSAEVGISTILACLPVVD
jgi:hypothetical protein